MAIVDKNDDKVIRLVTKEATRFKATVNRIDLQNQILNIDCPDENKDECAVAIQKILDQHYQG
jgi:hypothetical protein